MFTFNKDVTATNCEPGVTRKIRQKKSRETRSLLFLYIKFY